MFTDLPRRRFPQGWCIVFALTAMLLSPGSAQTGRLGTVEYTAPAGWTPKLDEEAASFTKIDSASQTYCALTLLKALPAGGDSRKNFQVVWDLVSQDYASSVESPVMQPTSSENGWTVETGAAQAATEQGPALLMLVTATGGGQVVSLIVLTNTTSFQDEVQAFIASLKLPQPNVATHPATTPANPGSGSSIPGLWVAYTTESSGVVNGANMLTGGYFRREYLFRADGTYRFRAKDWSVYAKDILFVEETGKWTASGQTLTLTPNRGSGGWWGKAADGRTVGWGARKGGSDFPLEKISYSFEIKDLSDRYLYLRSPRSTARDGRRTNNDAAGHEFSYGRRDEGASLIDVPPGLK